jgi:hypothetical protein
MESVSAFWIERLRQMDGPLVFGHDPVSNERDNFFFEKNLQLWERFSGCG